MKLLLATANRLALWRLAEFEREDINQGWWNQILIAQLEIAEKKERWRRRKSDIAAAKRQEQIMAVRKEYGIKTELDLGTPYKLWDQLTQFWHPLLIQAVWMKRETHPARIHVPAPPLPKPDEWISPSREWQFWPDLIERKKHMKPSKKLLEARPRPSYYVAGYRAAWKKKLEPDDWRIKYQRERQEEFLLSTKQKEAA